MDVFTLERNDRVQVWDGTFVLTMGWGAIIEGQFAWFSNILFWGANFCLLLAERKPKAIWMLGTSTLLLFAVIQAWTWQETTWNVTYSIVSREPGFWFWSAAIAGLASWLILLSLGGTSHVEEVETGEA